MMRHSARTLLLVGSLMFPCLTACTFFSGGDEAKPEEVEASAENNAANADAAIPDPAAAAAEATAPTGSDSLGSSDIPPELLGSVPGAEGSMDPSAMPVPSGDMGSAALPSPIDSSAPTLSGLPTPPSPAVTNSMGMAATGDLRVYYVNAANLNLRESPQATAKTVSTLEMGDPVLVKVEGDWANVVNRGWVEAGSLSSGPVARPKGGQEWN